MIKLYIDVDGVLLTAKNKRKAKDVDFFIQFILQHFDCHWLTTHCKDDNINVINYLSMYFDEPTLKLLNQIKPTTWRTLKTESLPFGEDFIWLDDAPFQAEKEVLEKHNASESLIIVNLSRENELLSIVKLIRTLEEEINYSKIFGK